MRSLAQSCVLAILAAPCVGLVACAPETETDPDASVEPGPIIVSTDPAIGETGVFVDKVIALYTSDHIDGATVRRSRFDLTSGPIGSWLMAFYDPVRRRLVVWPSANMRKGATWVLEVLAGLEGLDGGPVRPVTATWFVTGDVAGDDHPYDERTYEADVAPIFAARCASCHGPSGMADLDLSSAEGVAATALGRDADGWGGWPRIEPSEPGASYLLYKVIGDPRITGSPMPRSLERASDATPLEVGEQEILSDWIAGGAVFF